MNKENIQKIETVFSLVDSGKKEKALHYFEQNLQPLFSKNSLNEDLFDLLSDLSVFLNSSSEDGLITLDDLKISFYDLKNPDL